jgi:hypothetical protein
VIVLLASSAVFLGWLIAWWIRRTSGEKVAPKRSEGTSGQATVEAGTVQDGEL